MPSTPATRRSATRKPEPVKVLPCCSAEEYARRIAKADEVRDYIVAGYLAALRRAK
jgi:hypothetical protein